MRTDANTSAGFRKRQILAMIACVALIAFVYGLTNILSSTLPSVTVLMFPWESSIPFLPWMAGPYMSWDLLLAGAFFLCADDDELRVLQRRIAGCTFISAFFFLLLPTTLGLERPELTGLAGRVFDVISIDGPFNLFPSLHVSLTLVFWPSYRRLRSGWLVRTLDLWFVAIVASTVLVRQHHAIDIPGGLAVGYTALRLFPSGTSLSRPGTNARLGLRYLAAALALTAAITLWPVTAWALAWPAASLTIVAAAYLHFGPRLLARRGRGHPITTWLLLGPWLLGCRLLRSAPGPAVRDDASPPDRCPRPPRPEPCGEDRP